MLLSFKNKKSLILLSIIVIFCLIFIDNMFLKQSVIAYKATRNNYAKGVTFTGTVKALEEPFLTSPSVAIVKEIFIKEGSYVEKGQALALLDNEEALANVQKAKAQLLEAKAILSDFEKGTRKQDIAIEKEKIKELGLKINTERQNFERKNFAFQNQLSRVKRLEKLYEAGAVSFREYEKATFIQLEKQEEIDVSKSKVEELKSQIVQTQQNISKLEEGFRVDKIEARRALVKAKEAALKSSLSHLEDYTIKAPAKGYVSDVIRKRGDIAGPNFPVFKFVTDKKLLFEALVEENKIDSVYIAQECLMILDAYPLKVFRGKVFRILKEVNPQSGTFIVHVSLPYKHLGKFFAGMTGDITFVTRPKGSIIIPASFVFDNDTSKYVFKKKNNKAVKSYVSADYFTDFAIVRKGLDKKDTVLKPLPKEILKHNQRIKIKKIIMK